jgi:hypothetical protein
MRKFALLMMLAGFVLPLSATDKVSVVKLEQSVAAANGRPDKEVAERLGELELTERLSRARMNRLKTELPGDLSRQALLALADASAFLDLPADDTLHIPVPDPKTQGKIVAQAADFVMATLLKLPDFFASRTTTRFEDMKISQSVGQAVFLPYQEYRVVDRNNTIVSFRNGREVTAPLGGKKTGSGVTSSTGLTNGGVFGPLLGVVMADVLKGKIGWSHWEQGPAGPLAVFRYVVGENNSNYTVRYCCFRSDSGEMRQFETVPAYHGQLAIDPATGAVFRLLLQTDLPSEIPMDRADVVVEYASVEIGGRKYVCPIESASVSRAEALVFHGNAFYADKKGNPVDAPFGKMKRTETVSLPKVTAINDDVFGDYHQFRGEVRIVPTDGDEPYPVAPPPEVGDSPQTKPNE